MALVPTNNNTELVLSGNRAAAPSLSESGDEEQVIDQQPGDKKKAGRHRGFLSRIRRRKENKEAGADESGLDNDDDLKRMLDELDLATAGPNKKMFSLSAESAQLSRRFVLILKDLVDGVPTAADDLKALVSDRDGTLAKHYDKLPSSMKKIVTQLPGRMQSTMGPKVLAVAAEAGGVDKGTAANAGMKGVAKKLFMPTGLQDIAMKPSVVITMLKAIVNALKLRWPALLGTSVMWSTALFLLLFVLWYCHKRGKEVRLDKERLEGAVDGADRIEELPDDPALPAAPARPALRTATTMTPDGSNASGNRRPSPAPAAMRGAKTNPM